VSKRVLHLDSAVSVVAGGSRVNPSLANRLRLGFAITLAMLAAVTVIGVARLFQLRQDFEDDTAQSFQLELSAEHLRQAFLVEQGALRGSPDNLGAIRERYQRARSASDETAQAALELAEGDEEATRLLQERAAAERRWRDAVAEPLIRGRAPPPAATQAELGRAVVGPVNELISHEGERRDSLRDNVSDETRETALLVGAGLIAGLIAAVLLFAGLISAMRRPLEGLVGAAGSLAGGDLQARVEVGGPAETATLGMAFNEMADELQSAYRRVEENRRRLAVILNSMSDGVITVNSRGRVTEANPAAGRLLPGARIGMLVRDVLVERGAPRRQVERMLAGSEQEELRIGGSEGTLSLAASRLGTPEGGAVISVRDVSERARLERMKDEFVLTASHELRSPLTSVHGFAEVLKLERDKLDPKHAETVDIILSNTSHLVRLLNDLLDLARSDAGRLTINPEPCEVSSLVEDAAQTMQRRIDGRNQRLVVELEDGLPRVRVERDRIKQVLVNLLTNANEYCPDGAEIRVTANRVGGEVELAVADDGPGIPPDQIDHIFERFGRGEAGASQRVGGTGLGLAIARSLVEAHGGAIGVTSTPGKGSTFRVVLPALAESEGADADTPVLTR
jgi:signal transduction histidine kinase